MVAPCRAAQDQEFRERFEREAITIAKLRHIVADVSDALLLSFQTQRLGTSPDKTGSVRISNVKLYAGTAR